MPKLRFALLGVPGVPDPGTQDHFVHDLRGGITIRELGTNVLRAATLDQSGESLARILRCEDLV